MSRLENLRDVTLGDLYQLGRLTKERWDRFVLGERA